MTRANGSNASCRLDRVRVVLVDDSPQVRERLGEWLERHGATVTAVATAEEALQAVERERPDVLLTDTAMPRKGGYWLIGQVRTLPPECGGTTPAAAFSSLVGAEHRASMLRAGFQYTIEKPVDLRVMIGVVALLALKE
jgi:CheY-like chemotaxis protein